MGEAKINILIDRKVLSPVDQSAYSRCGFFVNTWNFEITHLQGGVQGFTSIQEIGRILPPTQKSHKNLGSDIIREHIEEPRTLASRWLYLCQGMLRNSNRRRPKYTHFSYSNPCVYIKTSQLNFADSQQHGISQL